MTTATNIAANGLLRAERDAEDAARRIIRATSESLSAPQDASGPTPAATTPGGEGTPAGGPDNGPGGGSGRPLSAAVTADPTITATVDLIRAETAFSANAAVFRAASEADEELGRLLDDEG